MKLTELSFEGMTFDDGRGKYPEPLKTVAPLGTRALSAYLDGCVDPLGPNRARA